MIDDFLYILFLFAIFSFIIYNFYIDYKNWRNVGGFAEGFDRRGRVQQFTNTSIPASSFGFRNRRRSRSRSLWSRRRGRRGRRGRFSRRRAAPKFGVRCASENGWCHGRGKVRYGKHGRYRYKWSNGRIRCNNRTFGDPYVGVFKECHIKKSRSSRRRSRARCVDSHKKCAWWARRGECRKNPKWMRRRCRKSCNTCGGRWRGRRWRGRRQLGGIVQSYGGQQPRGGSNLDHTLSWVRRGRRRSRGRRRRDLSSKQDFALFNERIMIQVLSNRNLIPSDIKLNSANQANFVRIGKNFMLDVSRIRNVHLPPIREDDYETLGRVVTRVLSRKYEGIRGPRMRATQIQLVNTVNGILSSSKLSSSLIRDGRTVPKSSTTKSTTGMMTDKSNAMMDRSGRAGPGRGMVGMAGKFSNSYKPVDDRIRPRAYDSVWGIL